MKSTTNIDNKTIPILICFLLATGTFLFLIIATNMTSIKIGESYSEKLTKESRQYYKTNVHQVIDGVLYVNDKAEYTQQWTDRKVEKGDPVLKNICIDTNGPIDYRTWK